MTKRHKTCYRYRKSIAWEANDKSRKMKHFRFSFCSAMAFSIFFVSSTIECKWSVERVCMCFFFPSFSCLFHFALGLLWLVLILLVLSIFAYFANIPDSIRPSHYSLRIRMQSMHSGTRFATWKHLHLWFCCVLFLAPGYCTISTIRGFTKLKVKCNEMHSCAQALQLSCCCAVLTWLADRFNASTLCCLCVCARLFQVAFRMFISP